MTPVCAGWEKPISQKDMTWTFFTCSLTTWDIRVEMHNRCRRLIRSTRGLHPQSTESLLAAAIDSSPRHWLTTDRLYHDTHAYTDCRIASSWLSQVRRHLNAWLARAIIRKPDVRHVQKQIIYRNYVDWLITPRVDMVIPSHLCDRSRDKFLNRYHRCRCQRYSLTSPLCLVLILPSVVSGVQLIT